MPDERSRSTEVFLKSPGWVLPVVILLAILSVAGAALSWNAMTRVQDTRQALSTEIKALQLSLTQHEQDISQRLARDEEASAQMQGDLSVVTKRLRLTQGELRRARQEATQLREENTKQIAALDATVKGELATKASTEEVKAVSGEVSGVRTDLDSTKRDFQMARSELGTLIARNHEEIDQLRRLGQRDYIEFSLEGKGKPQKVGNIAVELRGTNPKKHRFSLALVVEDLRVEKQNRTINEPIFFYTRGSRAALELVINQVEKNKIVGYLSVPKAGQGTAGS